MNKPLECHFKEPKNKKHEVLIASNETDDDDDDKEKEPTKPMLAAKATSNFPCQAVGLAETCIIWTPYWTDITFKRELNKTVAPYREGNPDIFS